MSVHDISVDTVTEEFDTNRQLVLGGAAATVVAVFLPWVSIEVLGGLASDGANGIGLFPDASPLFNGVVTGVLALAAAALLFWREWTEETQKYVMALGAGVAAIALFLVVSPETLNPASGQAQEIAEVSVDYGVYVTALGGALIAAGGYLGYDEDDAGLGA